MKTALVHDYLVQAGGAERVAAALHCLFPDAPLFTSLYNPKTTLPEFAHMDVRVSFLQHWPFTAPRWHKLALSSFPAAFEQFDFSGYDLVLSNTTSFAKGVTTGPDTCHVCYCHTPTRFIWRAHEYMARSRSGRVIQPLLRRTLSTLRAWDFISAQNVDYFVAGSQNAARRIRKYYRREPAAIVYPPVEVDRYAPAPLGQIGNYFLVVSRLVGYKRVDLAVEACNRLGAELRVVGTGPELAALRRRAGPTVRFLGRLPDAEVVSQLTHCRAFIFPGEEDFGLTPIEAMASGRPVVAYAVGGALETVVDGKTGLFFREQTPDALAAALSLVPTVDFEPQELHDHARQFDTPRFEREMSQVIIAAMAKHQLRLSSDISNLVGAPGVETPSFHFARHEASSSEQTSEQESLNGPNA